MTLALKRRHIFILSFFIFCSCILLTRINYLINGRTAIGKVVNFNDWARGGIFVEPIIHFKMDTTTISFIPSINTNSIDNETVPIIYFSVKPKQAMLFTFTGFWLNPLLSFAIPYFGIILPLIFGYITKKDVIVIRTNKRPWIRKMNKYKFAEEQFENNYLNKKSV